MNARQQDSLIKLIRERVHLCEQAIEKVLQTRVPCHLRWQHPEIYGDTEDLPRALRNKIDKVIQLSEEVGAKISELREIRGDREVLHKLRTQIQRDLARQIRTLGSDLCLHVRQKGEAPDIVRVLNPEKWAQRAVLEWDRVRASHKRTGKKSERKGG